MRYVIIIVVLITGCQRAHEAEVWFDSAPELPANTPVVVDQQVIGQTGEAAVVAGVLRVPIHLASADSLRDQTIFVVERDARGVRLSARVRGNPFRIPADKLFQFRGVATTSEYWLLIAREKAEGLIE